MFFLWVLYPGRNGLWSVGIFRGKKTVEPGENPWSKVRTNKPHIWLELSMGHVEGQCSHYCTLPTQKAGMVKWQNAKCFTMSFHSQHNTFLKWLKTIYFNLTWSLMTEVASWQWIVLVKHNLNRITVGTLGHHVTFILQ